MVQKILGQQTIPTHPHRLLVLEMQKRDFVGAIFQGKGAAAAQAEILGVGSSEGLPADAARIAVALTWTGTNDGSKVRGGTMGGGDGG